jgi:hypothetical protein
MYLPQVADHGDIEALAIVMTESGKMRHDRRR